MDRYKARLIAKDYTQNYGVDYLKMLALVTKMNTRKIVNQLLDEIMESWTKSFLWIFLRDMSLILPQNNVNRLNKTINGLKKISKSLVF